MTFVAVDQIQAPTSTDVSENLSFEITNPSCVTLYVYSWLWEAQHKQDEDAVLSNTSHNKVASELTLRGCYRAR